MARKKKTEEIVEEVEMDISEDLAEELPESFEDLADDDSPQYPFEEESKEIIVESLEEIVEEIEEAVEEVTESVVQAFVEFDSKGEIDLLIPMREHDWDDDVFVISPEYAERMLTNASARVRNNYGKVAFVGHDRQNRFLAYLATWMLRGEGNVLYLPEELADYEPLQELEKLDDAPEGFVAFSAK